MNPDTLIQTMQKSFRTSIGAAAYVVDLVQNPGQRDQNLERLKTDFNQLVEEWAVKGETTEQEARTFVETILSQSSRPTSPTPSDYPPTPAAPPDVEADLKDLTDQLTTLRQELEKLREQP